MSHYNELASKYDKFNKIYHSTTVCLIKQCVALKKSDRIVDIGGGTGEVVHQLRKELGIEAPGICVDPNEKMLAIAAKKDGIIPVLSTAEDFVAEKLQHPLNLALLIGVVHYLKDIPKVIGKLAEYIKPANGTIVIISYTFSPEVWFKEAFNKISVVSGRDFPSICEMYGLECTKHHAKKAVEMDKEEWYEALRGRYISTLSSFTDDEIACGIQELELRYSDVHQLQYDLMADAWIIKNKV